MNPTRRTQPHRRLPNRPVTGVLGTMMAGKPMHAPNPMDVQRRSRKRGGALLRAMQRAAQR